MTDGPYRDAPPRAGYESPWPGLIRKALRFLWYGALFAAAGGMAGSVGATLWNAVVHEAPCRNSVHRFNHGDGCTRNDCPPGATLDVRTAPEDPEDQVHKGPLRYIVCTCPATDGGASSGQHP